MNKRCIVISILGLLVSFLAISQRSETRRNKDILEGVKYNESIFLVSNYSVERTAHVKSASLEELLTSGVEGFYFHIKRDGHSGKLLLREPDGSFCDFRNALARIRKTLETNPDRLMTLFLDFYVDMDLQALFDETGLGTYLFSYSPESGWPALGEMLDQGKRLVVFDLRRHLNAPEWLLRFDDLVEGHDMGWEEREVDYATFFEDRQRKGLSFYTGLRFLGNVTGGGDDEARLSDFARRSPFLIEDFRSKWIAEGKMPNFVLIDQYFPWMNLFMMTVRDFRVLKGDLLADNIPVGYVNWLGLDNCTSGEFCFPLEEGGEIELTPSVPGYRVEPVSIRVTGLGDKKILEKVAFKAFPIKLSNALELYLPFDGTTDDCSPNEANLKTDGVTLVPDPARGQVGLWKAEERIGLPSARELNMRDHDFTVSVWLKIPEYQAGKEDYCVVGGKNDAYQKALHFLIRDGKPYMGFFNNDLAGNTRIEPGRWYHVVWRYNKVNGEQAIFVDGKLDAISWKRPAYLGSDSLYVGYLGFNLSSGFRGYLDDFAIWSRVLGDKEILSVYNQLADLRGNKDRMSTGWSLMIWAILVCVVVGVVAIYGVVRYRRREVAVVVKEPEAVVSQIKEAPSKPDKLANRICLFGDFLVLDRTGEDISALFTPKLRQLFLLLLVSSQPGSTGGISGSDLSRMIWGESDDKKMKSLRSVSLLKLRKILERLDRVEILFNANRYELCLSNGVYCDYLVCLRWLKGKQICTLEDFERFCEVIDRGELFKGESFAWLDDSKNYMNSCVVDVLSRFIGSYPMAEQADKILHVADQILLNDPCNSLALSYKVKILMTQGKVKSAHYVYDKFCALYQEMYGESYPVAFDNVDPEIVRGYD